MKLHAPGKLVLFGEYAVLEGHPALVAAVERYAQVEWQSATTLRVEAPNIGIYDPSLGIEQLPFIAAAAQRLGEVHGHFLLRTNTFSGHDGKLGLGSSAAATVAFVAAAQQARGLERDLPEIFRVAQNAHHAVQGMGSGADIAASTYGGVLRYTWRSLTRGPFADGWVETDGGAAYAEPVQGGFETLLTVWTGQSASTKDLVARVRAVKDEAPVEYEELIQALGAAGKQGAKAWSSCDRAGLMRCGRASSDALKTLGSLAGVDLFTEAHETLNGVAGDDGIVKPSGAGGGDLAWVIAHSEEAEARIRERLSTAGYQCFDLRIDRRGLNQPA